MFSWDLLFNFLIALAFIGLLITGMRLAWNGRTHTTWVVLGFAFLFAILLRVSLFKHFEGFGFKAELWDQKQIEAANLIDRLTVLSESTAQQIGLLASRAGYLDDGLTNPQLAELLAQTEKTLNAVGTPKNRRDEITAPIVNRIKMNYVSAARHIASQAYSQAIKDLDKTIPESNSETRETLMAKYTQLRQVLQKIDNLHSKPLLEANSLNPIIDIVKASPTFDNRDKLLENISEFDDDLRFFATNQRLKRNINLDYIYK